MPSPRKISETSILLGVIASLLGAIWSPEDAIKWVLTSAYLLLVGKYIGLNYKKEKVVGTYIVRPFEKLNFLNLRKR